MSEYSRSDRALHWLALDGAAVRQMAFEIERALVRPDVAEVRRQRHVFIAGLARAGTSILLRLLAGSGEFAVQTYRDMPFVLAPSLWHRLSRRHRRTASLAERAHKDGLEVGYDSVEAFEEVFWLTHAGAEYVRPDHLLPHEVDDALAEDFAAFVGVVLASRPGAKRYLSKNNNNVLRLPGVAEALPAARILVPFRDPVQQALSLQRQHLQFSASQKADPFERRYMEWLGHFEFGLNHRPFRFSAGASIGLGPESLDYWLDHWTRTYAGVLDTAPEAALFWDYDAFCAEPQSAVGALVSELAIGSEPDFNTLGSIAPPRRHKPGEAIDPVCLSAARKTYAALGARARKDPPPRRCWG